MPRKEFAAFTRLDASDVNTYLMDQAVQTFAGTAARGSAITTPVEGMYTNLEDTDRLEFWNGSSWQSPLGVTLLADESFTGQSTISVNNVFTSQYKNYKVILDHSGNATGNTTQQVNLRLRFNGSDNDSANYWTNGFFANQAALTAQGATSANTSFLRVSEYNAGRSLAEMLISAPFDTSITTIIGHSTFNYTNFYNHFRSMGGQTTVTTSYDGFSLIVSTGTITGNLKIYGLRG